jgi:hypothetical protein
VGTTNGLAQLNGFQLSGPGAFALYVVLDVQRNVSQLMLTWPNGTLLESTNVLGSATTNVVTSPFIFTPSPSTLQKYYRLQVSKTSFINLTVSVCRGLKTPADFSQRNRRWFLVKTGLHNCASYPNSTA